MTTTELYNHINSLPEYLKKEASDFIEFLQQKARRNSTVKERKFGYAKGFFTVSEDFDKPLDDFKEYM